jgi:hypothetical protein
VYSISLYQGLYKKQEGQVGPSFINNLNQGWYLFDLVVLGTKPYCQLEFKDRIRIPDDSFPLSPADLNHLDRMTWFTVKSIKNHVIIFCWPWLNTRYAVTNTCWCTRLIFQPHIYPWFYYPAVRCTHSALYTTPKRPFCTISFLLW